VYGSVTDESVKSTGTQYKLGTASYSNPGNPMVPCSGCSGNTFAISLDNLVEGAYTLYAKSTDTAGLTGAEVSCSWVLDFGPPETKIDYGPPTPFYTGDEAFFQFSCSEVPCVYFYQLDSQGYHEAPGSNASFTNVPMGIHTLQVYSVDSAGNADPTPAAYTWTAYDGEMYGTYCDICQFKMKEGSMTPLTFKDYGIDFVHGFDSSPVDDQPPPAPAAAK